LKNTILKNLFLLGIFIGLVSCAGEDNEPAAIKIDDPISEELVTQEPNNTPSIILDANWAGCVVETIPKTGMQNFLWVI
jgi:hypothetical protein